MWRRGQVGVFVYCVMCQPGVWWPVAAAVLAHLCAHLRLRPCPVLVVAAAGAYAAVDVDQVFQPCSALRAGFATSSARFKLKAHTPPAVGPGSYAAQPSWGGSSFNVTLDT